ncbi:MAG: DegQ family serine endoprotease [Myxococcales bacterium]|nr:DegQ family serine endoprotease [Myxococcales bacterium]
MKLLGLSQSLLLGIALFSASSARCSSLNPEEGSSSITESTAPRSFETESLSIADVSEQAIPSVVNISTRKKVSAQRRQHHPFFSDPFFRRFFDNPQRRQSPPRRRMEQSLGSGVIVKSDGTILTNNHVIEDADEVIITVHDQGEYKAKVVGSDPPSDLAVLKLIDPPKNLKPLSFGSSETLRLGEVVVAIGNPFGVGQTVTMGIVSAKGRANVGIVDYEDFIQTDAAINPGNSGGALLNMKGELVGINTAILSRSGGYQGIGFAIPSDMVKSIMHSLINKGKVVRGYLGVSIQDLTSDIAEAMDAKPKEGVLVSEVLDESPAAKAGIKAGDIIVAIDGREVTSSAKLRYIVASAGAGATVKLNLYREHKKKNLSVVLAEKDALGSLSATLGANEGPLGGIKVETLKDAVRSRFQISPRIVQGVVVTEVSNDSPAAQAGLRPGDVIDNVNRRAIKNPSDFRKAYNEADDTVLLRVHRGGGSVFIVLRK